MNRGHGYFHVKEIGEIRSSVECCSRVIYTVSQMDKWTDG